MRHLLLAAQGRQEYDWDLQSTLIAYIVEPYRDKKRHPRPFSPSQFNPCKKQQAPKQNASSIISGIATGLMGEVKAAKLSELQKARAKAQETGDWSEFKRLAVEINNAN